MARNPLACGQSWPGALPGPAGPGFTGYSALGLPEPKGKHHRKALQWTAGLLAAALLAGGGTIAGMRLAAHSPAGTSSGAATGQAGTAQGTLLNETLSDASSPGALTMGATLTGTGASTGGAAAGAA